MERQIFKTNDGRSLEGLVGSTESDDLLLYCHGTPFPAVPFPSMEREASLRGLKLVAWSRPGYGGSTAQPGRTVRSFSDDARAVFEQVGGRRALGVGWSGGGPHALSLGVAMADLCHAVGTIASVAPYEADDLDWLGGMGPENVEEFTLARAGGPEFDTFIAEGVRSLSETTADNLVSSMAGLISSVDEEALFEVDLAAVLAESARHGASSGPDGWIEDDEALMSSWGFSVAEVQVPVSLWHGSDDLMVPRPHGEWLAANLPDVSTHLFGEEGHLSLVTRHLGEVLDEVMSLGGI